MRKANKRMIIYLCFLGAIAAAMVVLPWLLKAQPTAVHVDDIWLAPCRKHPLGTDSLGRDVLVRLLCGGRVSLFIAAIVEVIAFPVGVSSGYLAAVAKCRFVAVSDALMDILFAFPDIILALFLSGLLGPSISVMVATIVILEIPVFYIYTKRQVNKIRNEPFIEALEVLGVKRRDIFLHHIIPHLMPLMIPRVIFNFATTIIFESTMSFIGIGIQAPTPSWGNMISNGVEYLQEYPWLATSVCIVFAFTTFVLFGLGEATEEVCSGR